MFHHGSSDDILVIGTTRTSSMPSTNFMTIRNQPACWVVLLYSRTCWYGVAFGLYTLESVGMADS